MLFTTLLLVTAAVTGGETGAPGALSCESIRAARTDFPLGQEVGGCAAIEDAALCGASCITMKPEGQTYETLSLCGINVDGQCYATSTLQCEVDAAPAVGEELASISEETRSGEIWASSAAIEVACARFDDIIEDILEPEHVEFAYGVCTTVAGMNTVVNQTLDTLHMRATDGAISTMDIRGTC